MSQASRDALARLEQSGRIRPFFAAVRRSFYSRARYFFPWSREADLEDSLQEALLAVFGDPDKLKIHDGDAREPERFEPALAAYVKGAALKQLISRLRTAGRDSIRLPSLEDLMENQAALDARLLELGEFAPAADVAAHWSRKREIVERCLAKLSELARNTFMLALVGHKDVEIQEMTQSGSAVAVRRRISETRTRVADCVSAASGESA